MKAHHHPGHQIWDQDGRTNCWLWKDDARACDWNGGELGVAHPGATMIWCTEPPCMSIEDCIAHGKYQSILTHI